MLISTDSPKILRLTKKPDMGAVNHSHINKPIAFECPCRTATEILNPEYPDHVLHRDIDAAGVLRTPSVCSRLF